MCVSRVCVLCIIHCFHSAGFEARDICTFATASPTISPNKLILTMASSVFGVSISQAGVERTLRPRSSTCNCAPVSVATAAACRVARRGQPSSCHRPHNAESCTYLANNPPAAPLRVDLNIFAMPSVCSVEASRVMAQCSPRSCALIHPAAVYL